MKKALICLLTLLTTACTFNISMAHTSGMADDVIDDNLTNTPDISPTLTIPLAPSASMGASK